MALTSRLPSRQPISYYALLLRGALAAPYLPAKDNQLALKLYKKANGEAPDFPVLECGGHGDEDNGIIVPHAASAASAIERRAIVGTRIVRPSELVPGGGAGGPVASSSGSASCSGGPGGAFVPAPVVTSLVAAVTASC